MHIPAFIDWTYWDVIEIQKVFIFNDNKLNSLPLYSINYLKSYMSHKVKPNTIKLWRILNVEVYDYHNNSVLSCSKNLILKLIWVVSWWISMVHGTLVVATFTHLITQSHWLSSRAVYWNKLQQLFRTNINVV